MKNLCYGFFVALLCLSISGCGLFSAKDGPVSELKIEDIQGLLRLGMNYEQLVELTKVQPKMMDNGAAQFNLENGELWVRFSGKKEQPGKIIFWGTITRLPDGTTVKKTSKEQALEKMHNHPICIAINIKTDFKNQHRLGKCYYEQYGPGNILVEAAEVGAAKKEVSVILINGTYALFKGNVPKGAEFKYLAGYMANLQLVQKLIAKGMSEATPVENGRRSFKFSSQGEPFVVETLNKKVLYPDPWSVTGYVEPRKDKNGFDFEINFKVEWQKGQPESVQDTVFSGSFHQDQKTLGENITLKEWKQFYMAAPGLLKPLPEPKADFTEFKN